MFINRKNHSQMQNQEEKICTLKKNLRILLMYSPRKCWRLEAWKGSCGGELLRKAVLRKGEGAASSKSAARPAEGSDTMKVCLGPALHVWTPPHTDTLSGCLVAAGRIHCVVCPSIEIPTEVSNEKRALYYTFQRKPRNRRHDSWLTIPLRRQKAKHKMKNLSTV